jgi:predicted nucleic acid-binding Zn ribbon protein
MSVNIHMVDISKNKEGKLSRSESGALGWLKSKKLHEAAFKKRVNDYKNNPKKCLNCFESIPYAKKRNNFCSKSCNAIYNNGKRRSKRVERFCENCGKIIVKNKKFCSSACDINFKYKQALDEWMKGHRSGVRGKSKLICRWLRKYLFSKYESKCCRCGWCKINPITNNVPLEVNHIDGNADNCNESNLELLCPNCHSLTPNFRSLNKKSKRNRK